MNQLPVEPVHTMMAGFVVPLWGVPIIIIAGLGGVWYRKNRDRKR
jgi:hypothetical protein